MESSYSGTSVIRAIARNSELIHELCTYCTWLYKNTSHKYIKHKNVYMYGIRNIYESGWAKEEKKWLFHGALSNASKACDGDTVGWGSISSSFSPVTSATISESVIS